MKALRFILVLTALCGFPLTAAAAKTFVGPAAWNHTATGVPGAARMVDVWKQNGSQNSQVLNVVVDTSVAYADAVTQVRQNAQDGPMKITTDKDRPCAGVTAHEFDVEFDPGTGTKILYAYTIVPDPKGITRITYSRPSDAPFNKDVQAALDAFCTP